MSSGTPLTAGDEAQLTQTIEMFEVITQSQPHDYQSLEILREAYYKLGREAELIDTSKRIARAYVQMGQLSSAILEYESILQRYPDDDETKNALAEIESRATSLSPQSEVTDLSSRPAGQRSKFRAGRNVASVGTDLDDGREALHKIFVEERVISNADFESCWPTQDWAVMTTKPVPPLIKNLADRNILPLEKSLKILSDKVRLGYLPIEKYDVDIELTRRFPVESCLRWCVLPFDRMSKSTCVATANPFNRQGAAELEAAMQHRLLWFLASPDEIMKLLQKIFR